MQSITSTTTSVTMMKTFRQNKTNIQDVTTTAKKKQNQFNDRTIKNNNIMIQSSQEKCLCFIFETILTFTGYYCMWNGYFDEHDVVIILSSDPYNS